MQSIMKSILQDTNELFISNSDYERKLNNKSYRDFIAQLNKEPFDLLYLHDYLTKNEYIDKFIYYLSEIKTEVLYDSWLHGFMHNERTMFFAYIISIFEQLDDHDIEILMDAAKYHDIGRINDEVDNSHGLRSANMVEFAVNEKEMYQEEENLNILKCAIHYHSIGDKNIEYVFNYYGIIDQERARIICNILKDADGLDRVRCTLGMNESELDPFFLRTVTSKLLIKAAHQLNELYLKYIELSE